MHPASRPLGRLCLILSASTKRAGPDGCRASLSRVEKIQAVVGATPKATRADSKARGENSLCVLWTCCGNPALGGACGGLSGACWLFILTATTTREPTYHPVAVTHHSLPTVSLGSGCTFDVRCRDHDAEHLSTLSLLSAAGGHLQHQRWLGLIAGHSCLVLVRRPRPLYVPGLYVNRFLMH